MTFIDFVQSLQPKRLSDFLFNLAFLLSPGYAIMFFLKQELFLDIDLFKLTVLAVAAISPLVLLNFIASAQKETEERQARRATLRLAIFTSNLVIYLSLFITFFIAESTKWFLIITAMTEILCFCTLWFVSKKSPLKSVR